jgi:hypothetical protein
MCPEAFCLLRLYITICHCFIMGNAAEARPLKIRREWHRPRSCSSLRGICFEKINRDGTPHSYYVLISMCSHDDRINYEQLQLVYTQLKIYYVEHIGPSCLSEQHNFSLISMVCRTFDTIPRLKLA